MIKKDLKKFFSSQNTMVERKHLAKEEGKSGQ